MQSLGSGRNGKSCRLRWFNQLDPSLKKEPFSPEEVRQRRPLPPNFWLHSAISLCLPLCLLRCPQCLPCSLFELASAAARACTHRAGKHNDKPAACSCCVFMCLQSVCAKV